MQGGSRQGEQGSLNQVDTGEMAGMPKDVKPPSASPAEHHSDKRQGMLHLRGMHREQVRVIPYVLRYIVVLQACFSHTCLLQNMQELVSATWSGALHYIEQTAVCAICHGLSTCMRCLKGSCLLHHACVLLDQFLLHVRGCVTSKRNGAGKGSVGSGDSWDPSSSTPSLDKGARVTDPRVAPEQRSRLSPTDVSNHPFSLWAATEF